MKLSSLFRKTLLGQTLLFGLVVGSLSLTSAYSLRWYLAGEYASRGSAIARSVSGASAYLLQDNSPELLQRLLAEFAQLQGVAYIFIVRPDGEMIAHTFGDSIPPEFLPGQFNPGQRQTMQERDRNLRRFTHSPNFEDNGGEITIRYRHIEQIGYVIDISLPLQDNTLGYVHVGLDQVRMINQIREAASLQLWVMLVLFMLSVFGTYLLVGRISRPLNQLTEYAKRLAKRDFSSPVEFKKGTDEIGLLASTMESMASDIQGFIAQLEDALTELKNTQAKLIQNEKMSSLGQLVAGVAHEINNPVSFIACNIDYAETYAQQLMSLVAQYQLDDDMATVEDGEESSTAIAPSITPIYDEIDLDFVMSDFPKVLNSMRLGTDRIRAIVKSLRTFSRLDESDFKAIDIHEGLDSTLMILSSQLRGTGNHAEIGVVKQYGETEAVECYAGQLNQVFMNILSNAIDALRLQNETTLPNPKITITTQQCVGFVQIKIHDNGPGIPPAVQSRLFDPFFTTKPIGQGTGLGLSISYQIVVQRHHGQLYCHSTPEHGTTFTVEIPLEQTKAVRSLHSPATPQTTVV